MAVTQWSQFKLLLWKNWVLTKRKPCGLVFLLIVPLFFVGILVLVRNLSDLKNVFVSGQPAQSFCALPVSAVDMPSNDGGGGQYDSKYRTFHGVAGWDPSTWAGKNVTCTDAEVVASNQYGNYQQSSKGKRLRRQCNDDNQKLQEVAKLMKKTFTGCSDQQATDLCTDPNWSMNISKICCESCSAVMNDNGGQPAMNDPNKQQSSADVRAECRMPSEEHFNWWETQTDYEGRCFRGRFDGRKWMEEERTTLAFSPDTPEVRAIAALVQMQLTYIGLPSCGTSEQLTWTVPADCNTRNGQPQTVNECTGYADFAAKCGAASPTGQAVTQGDQSTPGTVVTCKCISAAKFYSTEEELRTVAQETGSLAAGIIFKKGTFEDAVADGDVKTSKVVEYDLSMAASVPKGDYGRPPNDNDYWRIKYNFPEFVSLGIMEFRKIPYFGEDGGDDAGVLFMQNAVDTAVNAYKKGGQMPSSFARMQTYPYPEHETDFFLFLTNFVFGFVFLMVYIYPANSIARELCVEKEERQREAMRMMGLPGWINWLAWWVKWFIQMEIMAALITIMVSAGGVYRYSEPFVFFIMLSFLNIALISYGFFMSVFFDSSSIAGAVAALGWFCSQIPWWVLSTTYFQMSDGEKTALCFSPPIAMSVMLRIINQYEMRGEGINLANMSTDPDDSDSFSMSDALGSSLMGSIILLILTWYLNEVFPSKYGNYQTPLFFLKKDYWIKAVPASPQVGDSSDGTHNANVVLEEKMSKRKSSFFEKSQGGEVGVRIKGLRKVWQTPVGPKVAVEDLTLDINKNEVTALLGHNGAGKTTTMSIMTGMYLPTLGQVEVNGFDIVRQTKEARDSMGLCPQFDILFPNLTVKEHLYFFIKLKGETDSATIKKEIAIFLKDVDLEKKADTRAHHLSGGQKRALSVAIAFIGGSKVVILDEPTSGMDPQKRRNTWELITKHKAGRTILFTTHFMDEADLLGDKVAIMTAGALSTVGTPRFLKAQFGIGYSLNISKNSSFNQPMLQSAIDACLPTATIQSNVGSEIAYLLPRESVANFGELFRGLEDGKASMGIDAFGCSSSTMEEVFLKVGEMADAEYADPDPDVEGETSVMITPKAGAAMGKFRDSTPDARVTGCGHWMNKFNAMFYKRYVHFTRNWKTFCLLFFMPCLFTFIALCIAKFQSKPISPVAGCREFGVGNGNYAQKNVLDTGLMFVKNMGSVSDDIALRANSVGTRTTKYMEDIGKVTVVDLPGNMTQNILDEAAKGGGYAKSRYFDTQGVSASFNPGFVFVKYDYAEKKCKYTTSIDGGLNEVATKRTAVWTDFPTTFNVAPESSYRFAVVAGPSNTSSNKLQEYASPPFWDELNTMVGNQQQSLKYAHERMLLTEKPANDALCSKLSDGTSPREIRCDGTLEKTAQKLTAFPLEQGVGPTYSFSRRTYQIVPSSVESGKSYSLYCNELQEIPIVVNKVATGAETKLSPGSVVSAMFSTQAYHYAPEALNVVNNGILRDELGDDEARIRTRNCPFDKTIGEVIDDSRTGDAMTIAIDMSWGMAFLGASFILFPVFERQTEAKHVQFVSGADEYSYWLSAFAWDTLNMIIPVLLIIILFAIFDLEQFRGAQMGNLVLLLFVGFPSLVPIHYVLSFKFKSPSSAFTVCLLIFMVSSTIFLLTKSVLTLQSFPDSTRDVGKMLHEIFMVINPHYTIADGVGQLFRNYDAIKACTGREQYCTKNPLVPGSTDVEYDLNYLAYNDAGIGKHLVFLVVFSQGMWMTILFMMEAYSRWSAGCCGGGPRVRPDPNEDEDVAAENQRISDIAERAEQAKKSKNMEMVPPGGLDDHLVVNQISKKYSVGGCCTPKSFMAVKELSFGVPKGQCFGLLGVNGAGKTSTFRMLTKAVNMTGGSITVNGKSVANDFGTVRRDIGYCPQYNGFVDSMTGREMLHMFASLRGLPTDCRDGVVDELIEQLDLTQHADRYSGTYSGGNKRKLSTALALIGNPSLIFLDEPTSGMDPAARRFLWNVLSSVTKAGKSIVLTSHSMEECEVLCQRLGIMKAGKFTCIGSTQHLKSRFGREYTMVLKASTNPTKTAELKKAIEENVEGAILSRDQNLELTYKVPETHKLSVLFGLLAKWKTEFDVADYSLSQTTLEQIFLQFAGDEVEEQKKKSKGMCSCCCN